MKQLNDFLIPFAGLKLGKHQFEYKIDNKFFENFGYDEFNSCDIAVQIELEKKTTLMEFTFKHKGTVNVPCDVTGEDFDMPIQGKINLIVKFGDTFNDENEELLILPHGEHQVNVAQYIYESVALSVPFKRIHPGVLDGTLEHEALDILYQDSPELPEEEPEIENTDPRWEKLKTLLKDKK